MTPSETKLLSFLGSSELPTAARAVLKRSIQEFVLQYGWWYQPIERPKQIAPGTPQECHTNALDLTLADDALIYCEGYALFRDRSQPRIHAWVTDGKGNAIDNTWPHLALPLGKDFDKGGYFKVMNAVSEMAQETYLCPEFEKRMPGTGYRG